MEYSRPLFDLATRHTDVLQACYEKIADDYSLTLADLQSFGGTSYAESLARIACPNLNGSVDMRVDGLSGQFGVSSLQQTDQAKVIVGRCEQALREGFTEFALSSTFISTKAWFACTGSADAVAEHLKARQKLDFDPRSVGAQGVNFAINGQLTNEEEAWRMGFALEPSALSDYGLFAAWSATYFGQERYRDFEECSAHAASVFSALLSQFDFEEEPF